MRVWAGAIMLGLLAGCTGEPEAEAGLTPAEGAALFAQYCAGCHGVSGRGDGPAAAGLSPRPANLTTLARRNGGTFPRLAVLGKVYGYSGVGRAATGAMPEFGALLEGRSVVVETEPGIFTPTPERLVALVEHVERLGQ